MALSNLEQFIVRFVAKRSSNCPLGHSISSKAVLERLYICVTGVPHTTHHVMHSIRTRLNSSRTLRCLCLLFLAPSPFWRQKSLTLVILFHRTHTTALDFDFGAKNQYRVDLFAKRINFLLHCNDKNSLFVITQEHS